MSIGILEAVRDELIACEAVGSGRVFCESWLAKDASYIRVLKFHNKDPSADAFPTCASKLGYYVRHLSTSDQLEHQDWAKRFVRLQRLCHQAMDQQARKRWMTQQRMGASEMGPTAQKLQLRFFLGQYLQKSGGDFASPHPCTLGCHYG